MALVVLLRRNGWTSVNSASHMPRNLFSPSIKYLRNLSTYNKQPERNDNINTGFQRANSLISTDFDLKTSSTYSSTLQAELRSFFDSLMVSLDLKQPEELFSLSKADILNNGGAPLIHPSASIVELIQRAYNMKYFPWFSNRVPRGFWLKKDNQRSYLHWLAERKGFQPTDFERYYSLNQSDYRNNFGTSLLKVYKQSYSQLLKSVFPDVQWLPWKFDKVPRSFWQSKSNQKLFADWLGKELGYKTPEDWYKVSFETIRKMGGSRLLALHGSVMDLVSFAVPDFEFLPWKFANSPDHYWDSVENRKKYIKWLMAKVHVGSLVDLRVNHYFDNHGSGLLHRYRNSPHEVLLSINDSSTSNTSSPSLPSGKKYFFFSPENQKAFADSVALRLSFDPVDENRWYKVRYSQFVRFGGGRILQSHYHSSVYLFLTHVYPDIDWKPWKFPRISERMANDPKAIAKVIQYVKRTFQIENEEDWHRIGTEQLKQLNVKTFFEKHGGVLETIKKFSQYVH